MNHESIDSYYQLSLYLLMPIGFVLMVVWAVKILPLLTKNWKVLTIFRLE